MVRDPHRHQGGGHAEGDAGGLHGSAERDRHGRGQVRVRVRVRACCPSVLHARVDNAACWSPPRSNLYASYRYIDYATCIPVALKRCCRLVLLCVTAVDSLVPRSFRPRSRPKKHSSTQAGRGLGRLQRGPGFAQRGGRRAGEADPVPLAVDPERDDVPDRVQ